MFHTNSSSYNWQIVPWLPTLDTSIYLLHTRLCYIVWLIGMYSLNYIAQRNKFSRELNSATSEFLQFKMSQVQNFKVYNDFGYFNFYGVKSLKFPPANAFLLQNISGLLLMSYNITDTLWMFTYRDFFLYLFPLVPYPDGFVPGCRHILIPLRYMDDISY